MKYIRDFDYFVVASTSYGRSSSLMEAINLAWENRIKEAGKPSVPKIYLVPREYKGEISWNYNNEAYSPDGTRFDRLEFKFPENYR